jgi:UDP-3-O-[3-hydroxymyristoyl] glucosamine N-acyltransferase
MPDPLSVERLAAEVSRLAGSGLTARIEGDSALKISGVAPLQAASGSDISFLANPRYRQHAAATGAGALVLSGADRDALFSGGPGARALVVCDQPYTWFAFAAQVMFPDPAPAALRAPSAVVDPAATVEEGAVIEALAVVEAGAHIGRGARVGAGSHLGEGARIGAGTRLYPGVRVYHGCRIGERCIVHSGAVIGADGFGFAPYRGAWVKIPQTGAAVIGNDVEIGACSTIDRGAMGDTVVEDGVKIDNQVQIGHNCRIGAHTAIAGCVGIAGSTTIGRGCQIGGAAMIQGHISIADGSVVSGATAITRDLREPGFYTGIFPFMSNRKWERSAVLLRNLDELRERIRSIESELGLRSTESDK